MCGPNARNVTETIGTATRPVTRLQAPEIVDPDRLATQCHELYLLIHL